MAGEKVPSLRFWYASIACYIRKSGEYSLDTSILEIWVQHGRSDYHDFTCADVSVRIPTSAIGSIEFSRDRVQAVGFSKWLGVYVRP